MSNKKEIMANSNFKPVIHYSHNNSVPILPPDFGLKLLEMEYEAEKGLTSKVLCELVELYTQAIEYYDYTESLMSMNFQKKLHVLLSRFDVIQVMKSHSSAVNKFKRRHNLRERTKTIEKLKRICSIDMPEAVPTSPTEKIDKNIKRVVKQQNSRSKEFIPRVLKSISKQDTDLDERVSSRYKTKLNKSSNFRESLLPSKEILNKSVNSSDSLWLSPMNKSSSNFDHSWFTPRNNRERFLSDDSSIDFKVEQLANPFDRLLEKIEECRNEERKRTGGDLVDLPIEGLTNDFLSEFRDL